MRLYRYWARATEEIEGKQARKIHRFAGSNRSQADALARAQAKAKDAVATVLASQPFERYEYSDRPLREEIVRESRDGGKTWAITRNAYGSLVLNTASVFFADIDDRKPERTGLTTRILGWVLRRRTEKPPRSIEVADHCTEVLNRRDMAGRLYRTAAGHRLVVTTQSFEPESRESLALLKELGSDELYVALCQKQECFRARLTPKAWRCGADPPPSRYPWRDEAEESEYREWERDYHEVSNAHTTCRLVSEVGRYRVDRSIAPLVQLHDEWACKDGLPLA